MRGDFFFTLFDSLGVEHQCFVFEVLGAGVGHGVGDFQRDRCDSVAVTVQQVAGMDRKWKTRPPWSDSFHGTDKQKGSHEYQQNLEEVRYYIEAFSKPGDLICDPFGGGFTTAKAVQELGDRRFIGCDIDKSCVVKGQERLQKRSDG